jgi:glycosyltransferase involved in cell wall biosynthesis
VGFDTALRGYTAKRLEQIESADILIGIPCYNNETTILHVLRMVTHGFAEYYKDRRCVILVADGGSTDDSREVAREYQIMPWQEKIVSIYRGPAGKGSALRSIFEAAHRLDVKACAVVDSDLRSITSEWVRFLLEPVLEKGLQFVAPVYTRYKYDGTITNNIVYNLTRALYGLRIRQPIGGDFAFSREVARHYLDQDVWETDVARFGIDIWMTTNAITHGFRIGQAGLGLKIHDAKDPAVHLAPMFRQVLQTLFALMESHEDYWKGVRGSVSVPTFGVRTDEEPEVVSVDPESLIYKFKLGFEHFGVLWKTIFSPGCYGEIEAASKREGRDFLLSVETWVKILYELAATFHKWGNNRGRLMEVTTPLYQGRVASFINRTWDMNSAEAEQVVEEQAQAFEDNKDYLIKVWEEKEVEGEEVIKSLR